MADDKKEKLQLVDLAGIGNLLEHLVAEDAISCDERDRIIQKIARIMTLLNIPFLSLRDMDTAKAKSWNGLPTRNRLHCNIKDQMKVIYL